MKKVISARKKMEKIDVIVIDAKNQTSEVVKVLNNLSALGELIGAEEVWKVWFTKSSLLYIYNKDDVDFGIVDGDRHFFYNKDHPFILLNSDGSRNLISVTDEHIATIDRIVLESREVEGG